MRGVPDAAIRSNPSAAYTHRIVALGASDGGEGREVEGGPYREPADHGDPPPAAACSTAPPVQAVQREAASGGVVCRSEAGPGRHIGAGGGVGSDKTWASNTEGFTGPIRRPTQLTTSQPIPSRLNLTNCTRP